MTELIGSGPSHRDCKQKETLRTNSTATLDGARKDTLLQLDMTHRGVLFLQSSSLVFVLPTNVGHGATTSRRGCAGDWTR